jgi:hypothetical protein
MHVGHTDGSSHPVQVIIEWSPNRPDSPASRRARFEHYDGPASLLEQLCRTQTGETCTDNHDGVRRACPRAPGGQWSSGNG